MIVSIDHEVFKEKDYKKIKEWIDSVYFKMKMNINCSDAECINDIHIGFYYEHIMRYDIIILVKNLDMDKFTQPYEAHISYKELCAKLNLENR